MKSTAMALGIVLITFLTPIVEKIAKKSAAPLQNSGATRTYETGRQPVAAPRPHQIKKPATNAKTPPKTPWEWILYLLSLDRLFEGWEDSIEDFP